MSAVLFNGIIAPGEGVAAGLETPVRIAYWTSGGRLSRDVRFGVEASVVGGPVTWPQHRPRLALEVGDDAGGWTVLVAEAELDPEATLVATAVLPAAKGLRARFTFEPDDEPSTRWWWPRVVVV